MRIKIKQDNFFDFFDDEEENYIILESEEKIVVRGQNESDYIIIKCSVEGKLLITTNLTKNMDEYNLVKASQKLLMKKAGCLTCIPSIFRLKTKMLIKLIKSRKENSVKDNKAKTVYRYDSID